MATKTTKAPKKSKAKSATAPVPATTTESPPDTTQKEAAKTEPKKKLKCIWNLGTPCSDDVILRKMFKKAETGVPQIEIPICSKHFEEHMEIMLLHKSGYDTEEILQQTPEWRRQQVLIIKLSGLDKSGSDLY
jgi:hypothetical protein